MRSHPCVVVALSADIARQLREGDRLTLVPAAQVNDAVACFHGESCIGHIPVSRDWVARSLADGDSPEVTVTGFDTDAEGRLAQVEIAVALPGDDRPERPRIRSVISELGDELRILALVGAADGRLAPAERGVIEQFAAARAADLGLTPDAGEIAHAVRWARRHVPDTLDVAGIVRRLTKEQPEALPLIQEACAIVAEVDGRIAPEERQSMITLEALLEQGMAQAKRNRTSG
ncbi:MAG: TerB family tellurite resistance protein [Pseudomonadota bacterium]